MYSFPNFEPDHCSMSGSNCCSLTCKWDSQETGKVVWYSHLFQNFLQFVVIHTVKGFSIGNEAEVFLKFPCFLYDPVNVGNLIYGSSSFPKSSLYIWKFSVHVLLSLAWRILSMTLLACEMSTTVWQFEHSLASLWDWNKIWPSPVLWPLLSFPNLLAYWLKYFHT